MNRAQPMDIPQKTPLPMEKVTIGTRSSKLALWQADYVAGRLRAAYPGLIVEERLMKTKGDKILDAPLAKIGGKGLFTKELEQAMLEGEIDLAVHSLKDMPTEVPDGLTITAITERYDPGDAFVSNRASSFRDLPEGAVVGTSSLRRKAQLLHARPDLDIRDLRGNVNTRLRKLDAGEYDAAVLAVAGLKRLGFEDRITEILPQSMVLPAVGQGALAIETREDVEAVIASLDGQRLYRDSVKGKKEEAEQLGTQLADKLLDAGGIEIMHEIGLLLDRK